MPPPKPPVQVVRPAPHHAAPALHVSPPAARTKALPVIVLTALPWLQAPSEIRGKNVEAIIAGWTGELEARSAAFVRHAGQLADWDRHILTNRRALLDLEDELQRARIGTFSFHSCSCA